MYKEVIFLLASALIPAIRGSCIHGTSLWKRGTDANFGYTGSLAPQNWVGIGTANILCSTGKRQSPINLVTTDSGVKLSTAADLRMAISIPSVAAAKFENRGNTVEVTVNGTTRLGRQPFALKQFHFHTPSEHRISDEYFPLEMHMVHEAADGSLAVIAVLFEMDDAETTQLLAAATSRISDIAKPGSVTETDALDFSQLTTHIMSSPLFTYTGSLTTPPCTEGLRFFVTQEPMPVDVATFRALKRAMKFNSRYTQNTLGQQNIMQVGCASASAGPSAHKNGTKSGAPVPAKSRAPADEVGAIMEDHTVSLARVRLIDSIGVGFLFGFMGKKLSY